MEISKNKKCLLELGGYSILNVGVLVESETLTSPHRWENPRIFLVLLGERREESRYYNGGFVLG